MKCALFRWEYLDGGIFDGTLYEFDGRAHSAELYEFDGRCTLYEFDGKSILYLYFAKKSVTKMDDLQCDQVLYLKF